MQRSAQILPIILAGGEGRRLSPITNADWPKPFVPLPEGGSLLTKTCERLNDAEMFAPPMLVGQARHRFALLNHARAGGLVPQRILLEPAVRNTAMAVAVAIAQLAETQPNTVVALLPADHMIEPAAVWRKTIKQAAQAASRREKICLLAAEPKAASPEYGYMALTPEHAWYAVERFVEKPSKPAELLAENDTSLRWAWNVGQFVAPVKVIAHALATHAPDVWVAARVALEAATQEWEFTLLDEAAYANAPALSFDRAVMEKTSAVACKLAADWQDLGTISAWEAYTGQAVADYTPPPARTDRPWGYFELISHRGRQLEKKLTIYPGCRLSKQRHHHRSEQWEVIHGTAHVERGHGSYILQEGQKISIPAAAWHRLSNEGSNSLIIKEIQSGFPDENDIERADDDYGRA
jgi:mannose-1-phosphate guanylyltransferase/mannose-6-phosphate isomerase-like protein (cupin superfamily)